MASVASNLSSTIVLNDGVVMPMFGLGVGLDIGKEPKGEETEKAVLSAIKHGYKMIDTAVFYKNEENVGNAIKKSGVKREDLFVVTKADWNHEHGREQLKQGFERSLKKLGYIDLYLIHTPIGGKLVETYEAMLEIKKQGLVRSVGVANFGIHHLEGLKNAGLPTPSVNQIELYAWRKRDELVKYCRDAGITVMGYSPLAKGQQFDNPDIIKLSEKYNRTPGQVMIRWSVQHGYITIPKSVKENRIIENSQVFDWSIEDGDFKTMNKFPSITCKPYDWTTTPWEG